MADDAGNATTIDAAGCGSATGCASVTAGSCRASATACRGSTVDVAGRDPEALAAPHEAPLAVAAVLAPARGALDERRLVGPDASALSTLAGARGARLAPPCGHGNKSSNHRLSGTRPLERQLLTSRRRRPASSSSRSPPMS
jgi:hypothetical protein